jgi:hypothetical protein
MKSRASDFGFHEVESFNRGQNMADRNAVTLLAESVAVNNYSRRVKSAGFDRHQRAANMAQT